MSTVLEQQVLVLNQAYQPINVCNTKRAMILMFLGKADTVEYSDNYIRTPSRKIQIPSILRINRYIMPSSLMLTRRNVLKRDEYMCQYCGTTKGSMTIDHVVPKKKGGKNVWTNLVCACQPCNNKKGDRTPKQANMLLKKKPRMPSPLLMLQRLVKEPDKAWRPYLYMGDK